MCRSGNMCRSEKNSTQPHRMKSHWYEKEERMSKRMEREREREREREIEDNREDEKQRER